MTNMFLIKEKTKIYVMCPPKVSTGGPELLHQLVNKLNKLGFDAIVYYSSNVEDPTHPNYLQYNCKFVTEIDDEEDNLLIIAEIFIDSIATFKNIKVCVWWLSIDNFFKPYLAEYIYKFLAKIGFSSLIKHYLFKQKVASNRKLDFHLVQSNYAGAFLNNWGISYGFLSDYLNNNFLINTNNVDLNAKKNIVLYNPKKGCEFTKKIIRKASDLNWIPIIGMTPEQVVLILKEAKVYIDFGEHPGKDRFPREAALLKCCVITGKKGSAFYSEDVSILNEYKFDDHERNILPITDKIRDCLTDFKSHIVNFESYCDKILKEEDKFMEDIKLLFKSSK